MKRIVLLISALAVGVWLTACGSEGKNKEVIERQHEIMSSRSSDSSSAVSSPDSGGAAESSISDDISESEVVMELSAGDKTFQVTLEENETVEEFKKLLPAKLDMKELNGNEKYHYLDKSLPSAPAKVGNITQGDVMLYEDNCIVIFYKSFSTSYSYTKIGHINDTADLEQALGEGSVNVGFSRKTVKVQSANNKFDFAKKTVKLNSGYDMPLLGLGTWTLDDATAENSVYCALKDGYRLIDTAQYYGNEKGVGNGLKKAISEGIVKREDVFITTKVMPSNYDRAYKSIDESLEKLGVEYIDLMLIHQSGKGDEEVYKALCKGVKDGKLRSIGISNYYTPQEFDRVVSGGDIMPAVVQNENHPFYQNTQLRKYAQQYGTVVESWYPFGGRGHTQDLFGNETIKSIADAHGKTPAQVILRWHLQAGYVTIPGSKDPDHILENFSIFDFELSAEEMKKMAELNTGKRYENW